MADDKATPSSRPRTDAPRSAPQQGLRPIQIWVPDVRCPQFAAEARRQSLAVAQSKHAADDQAFVDAFNTEVLEGDDV